MRAHNKIKLTKKPRNVILLLDALPGGEFSITLFETINL